MRKVDVAEQGRVEVVCAGSFDDVAAGVAERVLRRDGEAVLIEPEGRRRIVELDLAAGHQVGPLESAAVQVVRSDGRLQVGSCAQPGDAVKLPAASQGGRQPFGIASEWELIVEAEEEGVAYIVG